MLAEALSVASAAPVHHTKGECNATERDRRQNAVSDDALCGCKHALALVLPPGEGRETLELRWNATQTRHHSPAARSPRKENWRKPRTSLMLPITGSTGQVRAPSMALPSAVLSLSAIFTWERASSGGGSDHGAQRWYQRR